MPDSKTIDPTLIEKFLLENHNVKSLNEKLLALGWDEKSISACIAEFKKIKSVRRHTKGVIYLVVGGFLGFISCILAIVDPFPVLHNLFLFGLTSLAILLACFGLYNIFE